MHLKQYIQDRVCEKNKVVESSYTTKLFEKNDTKYNSMINHENMLPISIVHVVVTVSGFWRFHVRIITITIPIMARI
jgi:hypothetical protein